MGGSLFTITTQVTPPPAMETRPPSASISADVVRPSDFALPSNSAQRAANCSLNAVVLS